MKKKILLFGLVGIALIVAAASGFYGYLYASTPAHIRRPALEHLHFRAQLIVEGQPVDFSADKFQQEYAGACSEDISAQPMHFHDHIDQMVHIHWKKMTGGELLKYYGWNFIGGSDNSLGWRFDGGLLHPKQVKIYGDVLPTLPNGDNFFVYVGDKDSHEQKSWDDFLHQDFETFFGTQSSIGYNTSSVLNWFSQRVSAHGGVNDGDGDGTPKTEAELTEINNLIGNVVIFVQPNEPTDEQVQARFDNLIPLQDSSCGG